MPGSEKDEPTPEAAAEETFTPHGLSIVISIPEGKTQRMFLHLPVFGQAKEHKKPVLDRLAAKGFVAIGLVAWQQDEPGRESRDQLTARVFRNFYRYMCPILGHTTLNVSRGIDWALVEFDLALPVCVGGLSMVGDIAVIAA